MNHLRSRFPKLLLLLAAVVVLQAGCHGGEAPTEPETSAVEPTVDILESETVPPETTRPPETTIPPETTEPPGTTAPVPVCPLPLDDWRLQLVNRDHPVAGDLSVEMTWVRDGIYVDSRCYEDLKAMLRACRKAGLDPLVCSGYRDLEYQTELFQNKVRRLREQGMSEEEAILTAQTIVALPGTSEHHIGLAVDIVDRKYQHLDERQEQTQVQKWLMEHCWEYGFILRYPNGKSDITGIIYEPWHYRYVGREVAAGIRDSGLCMEEYLAQFQPGTVTPE